MKAEMSVASQGIDAGSKLVDALCEASKHLAAVLHWADPQRDSVTSHSP